MAIDAMELFGSAVSVNGIQVGGTDCALVVFQTPPFTVATYRILELVGSGAIPCIAPDTGLPPATPSLCPPVEGLGPCAIQTVSANKDMENRAVATATETNTSRIPKGNL